MMKNSFVCSYWYWTKLFIDKGPLSLINFFYWLGPRWGWVRFFESPLLFCFCLYVPVVYSIWFGLTFGRPFFLYIWYTFAFYLSKKIYIYIYLRLSREDSLVASRLRVEGKKEYIFLTYCLQMILCLVCGQHKSTKILEMDPNMFWGYIKFKSKHAKKWNYSSRGGGESGQSSFFIWIQDGDISYLYWFASWSVS